MGSRRVKRRHGMIDDRSALNTGLYDDGDSAPTVQGVTGPDLRAKVMPVWRREMRGNGYRARWVTAATDEGALRALTFVANRASERYAGRLRDEEIAGRIASACGHIGPNAEYLLNTVARCEEVGIRDRHLWRMQALVAERLLACRPLAAHREL